MIDCLFFLNTPFTNIGIPNSVSIAFILRFNPCLLLFCLASSILAFLSAFAFCLALFAAAFAFCLALFAAAFAFCLVLILISLSFINLFISFNLFLFVLGSFICPRIVCLFFLNTPFTNIGVLNWFSIFFIFCLKKILCGSFLASSILAFLSPFAFCLALFAAAF